MKEMERWWEDVSTKDAEQRGTKGEIPKSVFK